MDGKTFDDLTRGFGRPATRRTTLRGLAAGAVGLALGRGAAGAQETDGPSIEACGIKGDGCFRNTDCCQGLKCNNGGDNNQAGKCVFKNNSGGKGDWCENNKDCKKNLVCDKRQKKSKNACKKNN